MAVTLNDLQALLARNPDLEVIGSAPAAPRSSLLDPTLSDPSGAPVTFRSDAERAFYDAVVMAGLPAPEVNVRFGRWEVDFLWRDEKTAVEVQGGVWIRTPQGRSAGHAHPRRIESDYRKLNAMTLAGLRTFLFTPDMVRAGDAGRVMAAALGGSRGER